MPEFGKVFNQDTVTFLNDLDNDTKGWDDSNDVINGQGGNDTLTGLSGDDILRAALAKISSLVVMGFWITSNALPKEADTITDFQVGIDAIGSQVCMG